MKKLIFVTLMAVAASWMLSEPRRPDHDLGNMAVALDQFHRQHGDPTVARQLFLDNGMTVELPVAKPAEARVIQAARRKGDPARSKRVSQGPPAPPAAAASPSVKTPPAWFPTNEADEQRWVKPDASGSIVFLGRLSASEARAREDLKLVVDRQVAAWLAADIPPTWQVPASMLRSMTQGSYTQQVTRDLAPTVSEADPAPKPEIAGLDNLYTLYRAGQKLDFSPDRRASILKLYRKDLAARRMQKLGGGLALALVGLAVLSGYIKADEATKGYYTNRLRLVATAGLGAAGAAAYRFLG